MNRKKLMEQHAEAMRLCVRKDDWLGALMFAEMTGELARHFGMWELGSRYFKFCREVEHLIKIKTPGR